MDAHCRRLAQVVVLHAASHAQVQFQQYQCDCVSSFCSWKERKLHMLAQAGGLCSK